MGPLFVHFLSFRYIFKNIALTFTFLKTEPPMRKGLSSLVIEMVLRAIHSRYAKLKLG